MQANPYLHSAIITIFIQIFLFFSNSVMATVPNPMMRTCNLVGGFSVVINVNNDQILLCHIGQSYIGSLELFLFKTEHRFSESIQNFLTEITDSKKCTSVEFVSDLDGRSYEFCFFNDGSIIDTKTFNKGIKHPDNQALKKVLSESEIHFNLLMSQ